MGKVNIAGTSSVAQKLVPVAPPPAVLWTMPKQDKSDNWMTCIPNLESCFTNVPYEEAESEFDFNASRDASVINRYKRSASFLDFEPKGVTLPKSRPVAATAGDLIDARRDESSGAAGTRESRYKCFQFSELFGSEAERISVLPSFDGRIVYF